MNRTRLLFIGVLALALGGLLSSAVYKTLQSRTSPPTQGVDVVVAANDINVGAKILESDIKVVKMPPADLPAGVAHTKGKVIGHAAILPITKGEFIIPNKLSAPDVAGLPALIPPGMRAVSVRVNEVVAVAGFVVPGTRVDVILTGSPIGTNEAHTTTVLEDVAVLAAGQRLERNSQGEPQTTPVITLLVSPEDAQRLTLASQEGKIQLSLRNPTDTKEEKLASVKNTSLYNILPTAPTTSAKPVKRASKPQGPPPPSVYSVEVIRGEKKEETKFQP